MSRYDFAWNWYLTFPTQELYDEFRNDPLCHDVILNFEDPIVLENQEVKWGIRLKIRTWKSTLRLILKDYPRIEIEKSKPHKKPIKRKSKKKIEYSLSDYTKKMSEGKTANNLFQSAYAIEDKEEFTWLSIHKTALLQVEDAISSFIQIPKNNRTIENQKKITVRSRSRSKEKELVFVNDNVDHEDSKLVTPDKMIIPKTRSRETGKKETRTYYV